MRSFLSASGALADLDDALGRPHGHAHGTPRRFPRQRLSRRRAAASEPEIFPAGFQITAVFRSGTPQEQSVKAVIVADEDKAEARTPDGRRGAVRWL
jgi:hypothetical protein